MPKHLRHDNIAFAVTDSPPTEVGRNCLGRTNHSVRRVVAWEKLWGSPQRNRNRAKEEEENDREMLHGVWRKKPMKQSKRRRPMVTGLVKYLATDSHMHAALLSPLIPCDLSPSRTVSFLDTGAGGGDGCDDKRRRFFERVVEYLTSDPHLYGGLVDAEGPGSAATTGPVGYIERVVIAVSRGMLLIEESRINVVPRDAIDRSEANRHPARQSQNISIQADKVKNKVLRDFRSSSVPGKHGGVITRSRKVAGD